MQNVWSEVSDTRSINGDSGASGATSAAAQLRFRRIIPNICCKLHFLFTFYFFLPLNKRQDCESWRRREIGHTPPLSRLLPWSAGNCRTYPCPYLTRWSLFTLLCRRRQGFETGLPAGALGLRRVVKEYKHHLIKSVVKTIRFLLGPSHLKVFKQGRFHF